MHFCLLLGKGIIPCDLADLEIQVVADISLSSGDEVSRNKMENKEEDIMPYISTVMLRSNTFLNNIQVYLEMLKPWVIVIDNWTLLNLCK